METPPSLSKRSFVREALETLLLILGIYTFVNLATARFMVEGQSMLPSFNGGEYLIVSRFDYMLGDPQRGDIVVFHYPRQPDRDFIKRVIGLPGETVTIEDGQVYINGQPIEEPYIQEVCRTVSCRSQSVTLKEDEYFVMGDNRNASQDSTAFGPIKRSHIIGRAWIKYWSPENWGIIQHHHYPNEDQIPAVAPTPTPIQTEPPMFNSTG